MKAGTIVLCAVVALAFVVFGFWWKAHVAPDSDGRQAAQPDGPARTSSNGTGPAPVEDGPPAHEPSAAAGEIDERPTAADSGSVSDEGRRLREALASPDDEVRRQALLALGKLDDTDPALLTSALAEDPSPAIRAAAARGLSRLKRREARPQLLDALDDDDIHVRTWAITALNNTLHGTRFPYRANEPREQRLHRIAEIRRTLTNWGVLEQDAEQ